MNVSKGLNIVSLFVLRELLLVVAALAIATPTIGAPASKPEGWKEREGRTLVVGSSKDMNTKHPFTRVTSVDEYIKMLMWEPVVMYDLTGNLHGILAESWKPNTDATEWTFHLRHGVKFHNGTEMTSADWVWSFNYMLNPANGAYANTALSANIARVEAVDSYTVKFHMVGPRALFPHVLSSIQNGTVIPKNSLAGKVTEIVGDPPAGTGPFKFVSWTPGTMVEFQRFDDYWGGTPYLKGLKFRVIANKSARENALRAGDVDVADRLTPSFVKRVKKGEIKGIKTVAVGGAGYRQIYFNTKGKWTSDKRVREAIILSLDRDPIVEEAFLGVGDPVPLPVPRDSDWFRVAKGSLPSYKRDLKRARQLLQEAGYNGEQLLFNMTLGQDDPIGEPIVRQAAEAGINIKMAPAESTVFYERIAKGDFNMLISSASFDGEPGLESTIINYVCEKGKIRRSRTGYCDPEFDALISSYAQAADRAKRLRIYGEMVKIADTNQILEYGLGWSNDRNFGWRDKVKNWQRGPSQEYRNALGGLQSTWIER
jgi:peptide/nickel transport system substrate-binding protein